MKSTNNFHESERLKAELRSGGIPAGSIIRVQWPSGNSEGIRVHGYDLSRNLLIGCGMGWDNSATEGYDLTRGVVSLIEFSKELQRKAVI